MSEIREDILRNGLTELLSLKKSHLMTADLQAAVWEEVGKQLRRLETALNENDETAFTQVLRTLVGVLSPRRVVWRGAIGPGHARPTEPPPAPVWETFNHLVDRLQRLDSTPPLKGEADSNQSASSAPEEYDGNR